eukprot:5358515-Prymnesium_polylepis.1
MLDDMVSGNVIAEEDKDYVGMASLVSSIVSPSRSVDTSPLYPEATISFGADDARTRGIRQAVKLKTYRLDVKPDAGAAGKGKGKGGGKGKGKGGGGGRGGGRGVLALAVASRRFRVTYR